MRNFATRYAEVQRPALREPLRSFALFALSAFSERTGKVSVDLKRHRVHFIYLHHVFRDEENEFRRMLSALTAGHYVVSYSEAVDRICQGTIDRPYLCFSFDDGLKNHLLAASILDEFGIKACFFVCSDIIGETDFEKLKRWSAERIIESRII